MALLATGAGLVGTAVAANTAPDCFNIDYTGDGTDTNPYQVGNVDQLQCVQSDLTAHYELTSDIDASETSEWNSGGGFNPIGDDRNQFTGTFDGQDHTISGLTINRGSTSYVGLFGFIGAGGEVKNVGLDGVDITADGQVGAIGGENGGTIRDSYATGDIDDSGGQGGGIVGVNDGEVHNVYADVDITSDWHYVGGAIGDPASGSVSDSYAVGSVQADGSYYEGGFTGWSTLRSGEVRDSYWDTETTGQDTSKDDNSIGLTTSQMQGSSAATNMGDDLDFSSTWETVEAGGDATADGYPILAGLDRQAQIESQGIYNQLPSVDSVTRVDSTPTNADSVKYDVTFSSSASNVDTGDFTVTQVSPDASGTVASVDSSSGMTIRVTVGAISGDGEIRLDVDSSVTYTNGETYTIDNTAPAFSSSTSASIDEETTGTVIDIEASDDGTNNPDTNVDYSLGSASGSDAEDFSIDSSTGQITLDSKKDFETPDDSDTNNDYELIVTATDDGGNTNQQSVTVSVGDVNDAPTMSTDTRSLTAIDEDDTTNDGTTVSSILASPGTTDDADGDTLGVAVTAVDDTDGTWEYSTNNGASWQTVNDASPATDSALLLAEDDHLRFVPNGDVSGTVSGTVTIRAWDQTSGSPDTLADTSSSGGTTAFSTNTATTTVTVRDAPEVSSITRATTSPTNADSVDFDVIFSASVSGVDSGDFTLTTTGTATTANGDGDITVSGSGSIYTVTVANVQGDGDLGVDVIDDDSITIGATSVPLGGVGTSGGASDGSFTGGDTVTIDNTAPSVSTDSIVAETDGSGAVSDGSTVQVTATVTDASPVSTVEVDASAFDAGTISLHDDGPNSVSSDNQYSATFTVGANPSVGDQSVTVSATDAAGNGDSQAVASETLTVDLTAPTVSAFDISNPSGQDLRVTFESDEQLSTITASLSGAESATLARSDFTESGSGPYTYTATYSGSTDGNYDVTLDVAKDAASNDGASGQSGSVSISTGSGIETDDTPPSADAGSNRTVTVGERVTLDGSNSSDNAEITRYTWSLAGEDSYRTGETVSWTFDTPGEYTVELEVTDGNYNSDTDTVGVTVIKTDRNTSQQNATVNVTESTVWDNETTIRQQVTVPENATVTRAERVPLPVTENMSEPVRVTFTQNASMSSIEFPAGTNGTVTVVEFDQQQPAYDDTPGQSVRQFQITGSPGVTTATATIRTRIAESALQTAGINQSDVRLAHRTNGSWQILNTTVVEETNGKLVLEATAEGLSPFAVTAVGTPEAALSVEPTAGSTGDEFTLNAGNSTTPYGEIVSYEWSVGGETYTGETATVTPEAAGEYTVELTVTTDAGRTAIATMTLVVENETRSETTPDGTPDNSTQTDPSTPSTDDTGNESETTTGDSGPGFGLIVALVALAGVALLAIRKSR